MKKEIIIIGGGIIGMSCAVELSKQGASVTVIDKGEIGMGCSYGNAGWMTPCFAMPLPMPGMFLKSVKWLLNPESPLYIKPSLSLRLAQWLTLFLKNMNQQQCHQAIEGLVALSKLSLQKYQELSEEFPEIDFKKNGLLMASQTKDGLQAAIDEKNLVSDFGVPGKSLSAEEIKLFEPSLIGPVLGGVYFPEEAHAEPLKVVQALRKKAEKFNVKIIENAEVIDWELNSLTSPSHLNTIKIKKINSANSSPKNNSNEHQILELKVDQLVLATGSWSADIAEKLKLKIPILGGKGYALIVPALSKQPKYPMMLIEKKIAITPRENSLRIAGTLELVDQDFTMTQRRIDAIKKGANQFLDLPNPPTVQETWNGLRPCTPDGVPLIGYSKKISNLMLACGHQMLGLQSGYGTGVLVAELMTSGNSQWNRKIFDPDRF